MPKNTHGGKNHKKGKNKNSNEDSDILVLAKGNQIYCLVKKRVGGTRLDVECSDGVNRSAIIPGTFYKRVWINPGDILLCDTELNEDKVCYILHKYTQKSANQLRNMGEINFKTDEFNSKSNNVECTYEIELEDEECDISDQENTDRFDILNQDYESD